ncbi:MAG TPA: hypothetical protein EYQ31_16500 [Candidatus Handelsmanbacteria bacterium]|nr:hypothetical protein [Candidatus Handelsmanbacteria bacterium]
MLFEILQIAWRWKHSGRGDGRSPSRFWCRGPGRFDPGVRAFNLRTGALLWTFQTIPQEGEFGNETWATPMSGR